MATNYARIKNHYKFKYHTFFSLNFYTPIEEHQRSDEIKLFFNLYIVQILTESDIIKIDIQSQWEHQMRNQETKDCRLILDKINSLKIGFSKTSELNGSSSVKIPSRNLFKLNIENNDKF